MMILRSFAALPAFVLILSSTSCTGQPQSSSPEPVQTALAPWQHPALSKDEIPGVYVEEWSRAGNRNTCALLAFSDLGIGRGAAVRRATFSGGWGVAYDRADQRSAFGIAGTAVSSSAKVYSAWPFKREWSDGSSVGYGPEGGTGPNQLAYLTVAGQACLYNVWSRLGREHLEFLLAALRRVAVTSSP